MERYILKVNPVYQTEKYRIIEIDGTKSLDTLCRFILKAFYFDEDHLYMFSMNRKRYDPEGYYGPGAASDGERSAVATKISKLGLHVRNKILLLYDFGDEWMFDITVKKIMQTIKTEKTKVTQSKGFVQQYGYEEEEYALFSEEHKVDCEEIEEDRVIYNVNDSAENLKANEVYFMSEDELYKKFTPSMMLGLQATFERDTDTIIGLCQSSDTFFFLNKMGVIECTIEPGDKLKIIVDKQFDSWVEKLLKSNMFQNNQSRLELFEKVDILLHVYGVIEPEKCCKLLNQYENSNYSVEEITKDVVNAMLNWKNIYYYVDDEEKSYWSLFGDLDTQGILFMRFQYPVKKYREFDKEEWITMQVQGWRSIAPMYEHIYPYLLAYSELYIDEVEAYMHDLSIACLEDVDKTVLLEWAEEELKEEYGGKWSKKLCKMIGELWEQHPSAILKGYSFGEYNKINNGGNRQLSLFDEELPF